MKLPKFGFLLLLILLPVSLVFLVLLVSFIVLVMAFAPPEVTAVGIGIFVVLAVWFVLRVRRGDVVLSEAALRGRQSSKEGLL